MSTATYDPLAYFEKLKAAGVPEAQARVQAETFRDFADSRSISKEYLEIRFKEIDARFREIDAKLKETEARLQYTLTVRLGAIVVACTALLLGLLPYLLHR